MIWFDLDNSPHVPLFRPIFAELDKLNEEYVITARDFAQTNELLKLWNIEYLPVGRHAGKNKVKKVFNLFQRSYQLEKCVHKKNVDLAVSHGSRTQLLDAKINRIQSILMLDYEYTESKIFNMLSTNLLIPVYIPDSRLADAGFKLNKVIRYEGFKEELYLKYFQPDCSFRKSINVDEDQFLVVIRPPSMVGNYHDPRSEELLVGAINYFSGFKDSVCLIINRTETEKNYILSKVNISDNIKFLDKAVDGLQLLYAADVSVSGGGTMNRESALLGTETYSIFTGKRPYLDEYLQQMGRLRFIEACTDFEKVSLEKKKKLPPMFSNRNLATEITAILLDKLKN